MTATVYDLLPLNTDPPLNLYSSPDAFVPNRVTEYFIKALERNLTDNVDVAFDIGSGTAPIAIAIALKNKAKKVYAVEPSLVNGELARMNIEKYGLENRITFFTGEYFDSLKDLGIKADVITADVSGIARVPSKVLCWYSDQVPCAGEDGTDIICEMLKRAPLYSKKDTMIIFPVATDLSAGEKIIDSAKRYFNVVENALWNESDGIKSKSEERFHPQYIWFPLLEEQVQKINEGYNGNLPDFINMQEIRGRKFWRGQILYAKNPK